MYGANPCPHLNKSITRGVKSLKDDNQSQQNTDINEYKIPADIKKRIPEYFYYALGGEYVSIHGKDALIRDENGFSALDYCSSTAGYVEALRATCQKLDMNWLFEYWNQLPWYQSDLFDGEIADEVMRRFDNRDGGSSYYQYLIHKNVAEAGI